jgi:hypothetical protein
LVHAGQAGISDGKKSLSESAASSACMGRKLRRWQMKVVSQQTELTDDSDSLSAAEVHDSIKTVSDADTARLVAAAQGFSSLCGIPWQELLQEPYTRALEGRRTCKRGTPLVPFICGVMRSFVSEENEARKQGFRPTVVKRNGEPILPDSPADDPSPERAAISAIDGRAILAEIDAAAAGDEKLQLLIEGIYDGMRGEQLRELLGVDELGLAALRKKLSRLIKQIRPDGIAQ